MTRANIIAWRDALAQRGLGGPTIRHRLASLALLFEHSCDQNAITHNPVKGVQRPRTDTGKGKTPALGDHQARKLLAAPDADTVKSKPTGPSCRRYCSTRCARRSCASCGFATPGMPARACRT